MAKTANSKNTKTLNLALQGGGSHGAYTWGVLDMLLEDGRTDFEAISATSAGSMNAVAFAYGMSIGGYEGARAKLEEFWTTVSGAGKIFGAMPSTPLDNWIPQVMQDHHIGYHYFDMLSRVFSPYQLNPMNYNPLREVLEKVIDFDQLTHCKDTTHLHLSATNVRTGKVRIFNTDEISVDTVLASACLPFLFQAVEIDGEHYWDGGYMGNPVIYPLIYKAKSNDVLIIHINPLEREELPKTAPEIYNRINEITFNSSLMREMRAIAFVSKLIEEKRLDDNRYNNMRIHAISNDDIMLELSVSSKFNPDIEFLKFLKEEGRKSAKNWLTKHYDDIGKTSSIDIRERYL